MAKKDEKFDWNKVTPEQVLKWVLTAIIIIVGIIAVKWLLQAI